MFSFCSASIIRASQTIDKEEIVHKLIEAKKLQSKITIFSFFKKITVLKKELELESKLSGKKTETIKLKAKDYVLFFLQSTPLFVWQLIILFLWFYFLFMLVAPVRHFSKKRFIFIILMILLAAKIFSDCYNLHKPKGIIVSSSPKLYSGPGTEYPCLDNSLQAGATVYRMMKKNHFIKIYGNDNRGWVFENDIEFI
jgi:hypothetical protein